MKHKIFLTLFYLLMHNFVWAQTKLTSNELSILNTPLKGDILRTLLITNRDDSLVLRKTSTAINYKDKQLSRLKQLMLNTVNDTTNAGVGIAAPQIGINRNAILVQRFDKEKEPFDFILNPTIVWHSNLIQNGREGCLSIPNEMGMVDRYYAIKIKYQREDGQWIEEIVEGFTAVIFQHEIDHLNGVLFTDRIVEQNKKQYHKANNSFKYLEEKNTR